MRVIPIFFNQVGRTLWRIGIEYPRALMDAPTMTSLFHKGLGLVDGSFRARFQSRFDVICSQPERTNWYDAGWFLNGGCHMGADFCISVRQVLSLHVAPAGVATRLVLDR